MSELDIDIRNAVDSLLSQGEPVTVDSVQEEIRDCWGDCEGLIEGWLSIEGYI